MLKFIRRLTIFIAKDMGWDVLCLAFLALVTLVFMGRVVFQGKVLLPLDMIYTSEPWLSESTLESDSPPWNPEVTDAIWQFLPMGSHAQKSRQAGRTPFWDSSILAGLPALARGEMFSNPVFRFTSSFLPVEHAISWAAVLYVLIGGISMFLFLRELGARQPGALVGSSTFILSSYLIGWLSLPVVTGSMVWLPIIFWSYERSFRKADWRWALPGALAFAAQILSGHILWPFYGAITFGLYLVYRSALEWWDTREVKPAFLRLHYGALILIIGTGLVITQLSLTIQLYYHSVRTEALGSNSFLNIFTHMPRLLAPGYLGMPLNGDHYKGIFNYVETNLYIGILPLFFCLAGLSSKHRRLIYGFGILGVSCLLAVYKIFPFPHIIKLLFPVFFNTFPGRIFYIVTFTSAIIAGLGADGLFDKRPKTILIRLSLASAIIASLFIIFYGILRIMLPSAWFQAVLDPKLLAELMKVEPGSLLLGSAWLAGTSILLWLWQNQKVQLWKLVTITLVIIYLDLGSATLNLSPAFDPDISFPLTPSLQFLQKIQAKQTQPSRILNVYSWAILPGMSAQYFELPTVSGYSSWSLARYSLYSDLTGSRGAKTVVHIYFHDCCTPLLNALNIKYVYTSPNVLLSSSGSLDLTKNFPNAVVMAVSPEYVHQDTWVYEGKNKPILYQHPPSKISYTLNSDHLSKFISALALDSESWLRTDGVEFVVSASVEGEEEEVLFSRYVNPKNKPEDRKWIPVEIDLSRYQGREFKLSLSTNPGPFGDASFDWAGWVSPQILDYYPNTLQLIYDGPNKVYENKAALSRAWIVHRVTHVPQGDTEAIAQLLSSADFNPAVEGIIESSVNANLTEALGEPDPDDRVNILSYLDEQVKIEVSAATPGLLVLSDNMYPGWKAYVDGDEQPIVTTNLIMRGVFIPSGNHQIDFVFRPSYYTITTTITRIIVAFIIIGFIFESFWRSAFRKR